MPFARFDYSLDYKNLDLRQHPELYRTGVGEQGVLLVEPYKTEILPHWRFKTPAIAKASAAKILELFLRYKKQNDFVGMDMARKYLQMGYTRSRRYANHKSGKKYDGPVPADKKSVSGAHGRGVLP
jgi:DNA helicase HerA-like ATPase